MLYDIVYVTKSRLHYWLHRWSILDCDLKHERSAVDVIIRLWLTSYKAKIIALLQYSNTNVMYLATPA